MKAGTARIEITPACSVFMDGMIRAHASTGVHDPLFVKALVLAGDSQSADVVVIVSLDVCALSTPDCLEIRSAASRQTGISADRIILAATHTHSGPAVMGVFDTKEQVYLNELTTKTVAAVKQAFAALAPAAVGCGSGREETISHYRRLLADDGHVVMNWEPWPEERIVRTLGVIDPEVGVMKIVSANGSGRLLGLLFNHAGHPNVMSGDNYLISSEYPGRAEALLEQELGGTALFINGAQGTMDIDGLKDRDWSGMERVAKALADEVSSMARDIVPRSEPVFRNASCRYTLPARKITDKEKAWAENILKRTGGKIQSVADGVGDDFKAALFQRLWKVQDREIDAEQVCVAIDDCAFISFPGELFTEIGMRIKTESPFRHTYILGLANGYVGYVPTRQAIAQGGYEPEIRLLDAGAGDIIVQQSLALLRQVHG